ncbi:MAG: diaminopimelate epimerase [Erysipelotrichaceae bacterium]|nr:diaminopimelate epimerase [Erysipelotrichaceae bacterium]
MLKFTKMEGIGNDYIYFDGIHQNIPMDETFIKSISDRHFGIGSDGMIVILKSDQYDFKMRMFNLDGSEGMMCGNGLRCFCKFVYDHQLTSKTHLMIETKAGLREAWLEVENNLVKSVKVDMGEPIIQVKDIPCLFDKDTMIHEPIQIHGQTYYLTAVSMGNPHVVMFADDLDFDIADIGPIFEKHPMFPQSVNTEWVEVIDRGHVRMRVWERGSGETMACGTGACAVMYACYLNDVCDEVVQVDLLGGSLDICFKNGHIYMSGQARTTFEGIINEEDYIC